MAKQRQAYIMPANPQPTGVRCIRVYVPDDPLYIAALWGSYEYLTTWLAWETDDSHLGKDAADVWKPAFLRAREEWDCAEGSCGLMDVRQSETEPCVLEKLDDCTGAWEEFADLSLCKNEPLPAVQSEEWLELLDALLGLKSLLELIDAMLDNGQSASMIKLSLAPLTQSWPNLPDMIDAMSALTPEERADALNAVDWQSAALTIWCQTDCDLQDFGSWPTFGGWMTCATDAIRDWALNSSGDVAEWVSGVLDSVADGMGLGWVTSSLPGQNANWEWGDPVCSDWMHVFDFREGMHGWTIDTVEGQPAGIWESGIGVHGVFAGVMGWTGAYRVFLTSPLVTETTMVAGGFMVSYDPAEDYYCFEFLKMYRDGAPVGDFVNHPGIYHPPNELYPDGWKQGEATASAKRVVIWLNRIHSGAPTPDQGDEGGILMTRIVIWGTGTDPF